jgi:hypothetical protein
MKRLSATIVFLISLLLMFGCKIDERPIKNSEGENVLESYIKKPIDKANNARSLIESKQKNLGN